MTPITPPIAYRCADGQGFIASVFARPDRVELAFADGAMMMLPQAPSASGSLYESAAHRLHLKGDDALWKRSGREETRCSSTDAGEKKR